MTKSEDLEKRTITINRTFDAPIQLVWEAWTQPEHISKWWGPKGMDIDVVEHNFTVGGSWKYTMAMPDGKEFVTEGVYSLIVELEKIFSSADFRPMTEGVEIQSYFKPNGDKTDFTFKVVHPTEEYRNQQEAMGFYKGWGSVFNNLEEHLSSIS